MARTLSWRSGWLLACPHQPDLGHREGSLVKSTAALELLGGRGPRTCFALRASRPALAPPSRERQRERRRARRGGGACNAASLKRGG